MKELSEIFQGRWDYHLIIRAAGNLENRYSYDVIDDLGINNDSMPTYNPTTD
jgi:hypothetical protein